MTMFSFLHFPIHKKQRIYCLMYTPMFALISCQKGKKMKLSKETINTEDDEVTKFHPEAATVHNKCGVCISSHAPQACPKDVHLDANASPPVHFLSLLPLQLFLTGLLFLGYC